jgi:hypothetical protein
LSADWLAGPWVVLSAWWKESMSVARTVDLMADSLVDLWDWSAYALEFVLDAQLGWRMEMLCLERRLAQLGVRSEHG